MDAYAQAAVEMTSLLEAFDDISDKSLTPVGPRITKSMEGVIASLLKDQEELGKNVSSSNSSASKQIVWIGLGSILIGIGLSIFITQSITKPVNRITASLSAAAEQTSSAASQVSTSSQSMAQGASEQAASLEETTSAMEEMSGMIRKSAESAVQAASLAAEARTSADQGRPGHGQNVRGRRFDPTLGRRNRPHHQSH